MARVIFVTAWLTLLSGVIAGLFWYHDWMYKLPTPVPANYKPVARGTRIDLRDKLNAGREKPLFVHFYNPDCPCSRFNKSHFQSLVKSHGEKVDFVVVVLSSKPFSQKAIQDKLGLKLPVSFDQSIAARCGVYSTPQAALIDTRQRLYYRGNYNASRYCTDEKTAFAQIALTALLKSESSLVFSDQAIKSYGCTIPLCKY